MPRLRRTSPVIAGLDPAIHQKQKLLRYYLSASRTMDARVKPGHDASSRLNAKQNRKCCQA